ncbi:tRNA 2-selenouridine(34) synthase MnmH [Algoriphagus kandeliae]|uniref:tRNA 2-selenouridine(34) synthase MnmH n=1 Tax=Algoriphagus kandeliae TaxID=2562278 RepID=A0A4Y9QUQ5_9BACT|nr:tRNA 2-selenouridine(34) synthase MnmH [Algoriphagus kandeliae]TFV96239.1 tRNA 2-selenouridine(34) synthase MnmH [Algoriphagus kandeliae]
MKETLISLSEFLELRQKLPILDARSEGEFSQSHIPEAVNIPILNDQERKVIGTLYKEEGSEKATLKGFELVGPRFHQIQKEAIKRFPNRKIILYCWRGGMRSQILSWLLSMVGFEVFRLKGGYKTYRNFTFEEVRKKRNFIVLGGKTGTAKTVLLQYLKEAGEQVLDLENLAHHKGSAFGGIGQAPQPSVEQFENKLTEALLQLNSDSPIWVENESRKIGRVILPDIFFSQMQASPHLDISKSEHERIAHIESEYAGLPKEELKQAVKKLSKKLGGLRTKEALEAIEEGDHPSWIQNLLTYYDKAYEFELEKHPKEHTLNLDLTGLSLAKQIDLLIQSKDQLYERAKNTID